MTCIPALVGSVEVAEVEELDGGARIRLGPLKLVDGHEFGIGMSALSKAFWSETKEGWICVNLRELVSIIHVPPILHTCNAIYADLSVSIRVQIVR